MTQSAAQDGMSWVESKFDSQRQFYPEGCTYPAALFRGGSVLYDLPGLGVGVSPLRPDHISG